MNVLRLLAGLLVIACFFIGTLMSVPDERAFGHTLVIAGAVIFAGLLISLAVNEKH